MPRVLRGDQIGRKQHFARPRAQISPGFRLALRRRTALRARMTQVNVSLPASISERGRRCLDTHESAPGVATARFRSCMEVHG